MRAAVLEAVGQELVIDDVDLRDPGPGEITVDVVACGACHSDLSVADGSFPQPLPIVLGHEAAGTVAAVGPGVRHLAPGQPVILTPAPPCNRCYWCVRGEHSLCADVTASLYTAALPDGTTPLSRGGAPLHRGLAVGAFAERVLTMESGAVPIPTDVPLDVACVIGCAVQTGVGAVLNTARVPEGATAVVFGAGGIGLSVTQGLRLAGASLVMVVDPVADRRDAAEHFGATHTCDPAADDVARAVRQLTNGIGVDYAFEAAGRAALIEQALTTIRSGGTVVCVGAPPVDEGISIPGVVGFAASEKKLVGCLLGSSNSHRDIPRLVALWQAGRLDLEGMITNRVPLADINHAFDDLRDRKGIRTVVEIAK
jgi:Zn-dependent alcohol dehydrogenase